ncbi:MAG: ATPase [Bacteroidales bacterium]|nr:ATPase [Bacteroidales bacterium]
MEQMPFTFGKTTDKVNFTDREVESKHLEQNFRSAVNTMLISPRRWGKSSLVERVTETIAARDSNIKFCLLDVFNVQSEAEFYENYARAIVKATSTKWEEWTENAREFVSRLFPKISFSPDNMADITFGIDFAEVQKQPDDIIDLAETIAVKRGIKIVVCIDEFQNIANFESPLAFQQKLRAHWQRHHHVCYCLYGSKRHILADIFANPSMPFYKFGDIILLEKISSNVWGKFIRRRFKDTGKHITLKMAELIAQKVDNHSYYVQQLAQQVWLRTKTNATQKIIDDAFESLKNQLSLLFTGLTETLTATQINFLKALLDGVTTFGQENLLKYKLGTSANILRIKDALLSKEIIDITPNAICFQDPMYRYWLKKDCF